MKIMTTIDTLINSMPSIMVLVVVIIAVLLFSKHCGGNKDEND